MIRNNLASVLASDTVLDQDSGWA